VKKIKCPNCNTLIYTDNELETRCINCEYLIVFLEHQNIIEKVDQVEGRIPIYD
jgi:ribosomal protein S27E